MTYTQLRERVYEMAPPDSHVDVGINSTRYRKWSGSAPQREEVRWSIYLDTPSISVESATPEDAFDEFCLAMKHYHDFTGLDSLEKVDI